jgi:Fic family protein
MAQGFSARLPGTGERSYEETHPWIDFSLDMRRFSHRLWMLLGEAQSKCEHLAGVPLRPTTARELHGVYLSKGVHATTSIEGNTLTEDEVRQRVDGTLKLPDSRAYQGREVDNIIGACNLVTDKLRRAELIELDPATVSAFNYLVLDGLEVDEDTIPGRTRSHSVAVGRYLAPPPQDIDYLIERLCKWLNGSDFIETEDFDMAFVKTIVKAVLAHLYIAWVHPFGDGNGRTARLIEFLILVGSGRVPTPAAHLMSNHYNLTRDRYYRELAHASATGDVCDFIEYAVEGFVDGLREQIGRVQEQQLSVTWENFVHRSFSSDPDTPATRRRKHLVLDLPTEGASKRELRHVSPRVAEEYAKKGGKTLTRDINALLKMGLVVPRVRRREEEVTLVYRPNRAEILSFLPLTAGPPQSDSESEQAR